MTNKQSYANRICESIAEQSATISEYSSKAINAMENFGYSKEEAIEAVRTWYNQRIEEIRNDILYESFAYGYLWTIWNDGTMKKIPCDSEQEGTYKLYSGRILGKNLIENKSHAMLKNSVSITNVIFSGKATIVFFSDGSKTIVKCSEKDIYDKEKGLAMALVKRAFGNKSCYNDIFHQWIPDEPFDEKNDISEESKTEKKTVKRTTKKKEE